MALALTRSDLGRDRGLPELAARPLVVANAGI